MENKLDELVTDAVKQCFTRAYGELGREPTAAETTAILFQSQLAVLAMYLCEDDAALVEYWENVGTVIRQGKVPGAAS